MTYRILVTGTRSILTSSEEQIVRLKLEEWVNKFAELDDDDFVIVHGGCPTGVDDFAEDFAMMAGVPTERHPADWKKHGKAAGPIRNREMVEAGADVILGFPKGVSRGTWDCLNLASEAGILRDVWTFQV